MPGLAEHHEGTLPVGPGEYQGRPARNPGVADRHAPGEQPGHSRPVTAGIAVAGAPALADAQYLLDSGGQYRPPPRPPQPPPPAAYPQRRPPPFTPPPARPPPPAAPPPI